MRVAAVEVQKDLVIAIQGRWHKEANVSIILDPENHRVYDSAIIGSGCPEAVFHRRHYVLAHISPNSVVESVREAVQEASEEILNLASCYLETVWDGHNHVGRWSWDDDDEDDPSYEIDLEGIRTYWDASEWLYGDISSVLSNCLSLVSVDEAAESEVEEARYQNIELDSEDVKRELVYALETRVLSSENSLYDAHEKRVALKMLASYLTREAYKEYEAQLLAEEISEKYNVFKYNDVYYVFQTGVPGAGNLRLGVSETSIPNAVDNLEDTPHGCHEDLHKALDYFGVGYKEDFWDSELDKEKIHREIAR